MVLMDSMRHVFLPFEKSGAYRRIFRGDCDCIAQGDSGVHIMEKTGGKSVDKWARLSVSEKLSGIARCHHVLDGHTVILTCSAKGTIHYAPMERVIDSTVALDQPGICTASRPLKARIIRKARRIFW